VMIAADFNALTAALALGGVDKDAELRTTRQTGVFFALFLELAVVFHGGGELLAQELLVRLVGHFGQFLFQVLGHDDLAKDSRILAVVAAIHAAHAVFGHVFGQFGGNIAEIPCSGGSGRQNALRHKLIGGLAGAGAAIISVNDFRRPLIVVPVLFVL